MIESYVNDAVKAALTNPESRPAKAGEPLERIDRVHLVAGDTVVAVAQTYRGEGLAFG